MSCQAVAAKVLRTMRMEVEKEVFEAVDHGRVKGRGRAK